MKKNKESNLVVIAIVAFFMGVLALYGVIRLFPAVILKEITRLDKKVTITDSGIAESVEKVYDSVVVVSTFKNNSKIASGTGFVYKVDGNDAFILTNNHVVEKGDSIKVTFTNEKEYQTEVVGTDKLADIAVLKLSKESIITVAEIGSSQDSRVGDTVFAVGAPLDSAYSWTVTRGILSGKDRLVEVSTESSRGSDWVMSVMQTDAAINSGNSGGPLANANGEVIGITSLKLVSSGIEGMGFAIPIENAIDYAERIIRNEEITQPYLGITMVNVEDAYYSREYYETLAKNNLTSGVLVTSVEEDSDAKKGGIEKNDVIIELDGKSITSLAFLRYELYKHDVGDKINIKVNRDGKIKELTIKLNNKKTISNS